MPQGEKRAEVPFPRTRSVADTTDRNRHYSAVNVDPVDPRDQAEEVDEPRYRVYFWQGIDSDEYEITGADVHEVLDFADRQAAGRTYSLWVCLPARNNGVNLVRLAGWDPPAGDAGRPAHAVTVPTLGGA